MGPPQQAGAGPRPARGPGVRESLLPAAILFAPLAFGCVEPWSAAALEALLLALCWGPAPPAGAALLAAPPLGLIALGALQRLDPRAPADPWTLLPFTASRSATSAALIQWAAYAALLLYGPEALRRPASRRRLLWTLSVAGALVAAVGLVQLAAGNTSVYGLREVRYNRSAFGPFFNRSHAASFLCLSLLAGTGLAASRVYRFRRESPHGARAAGFLAGQALLGGFLVLQGIALLRLENVGSTLALAGAGWVMAFAGAGFLRSGHGPAVRVLLALLALLAAATASTRPELLGMGSGAVDNSVSYRLALYRGAARLWADAPLFGVGLGAIPGVFESYKDPLLAEYRVDHIHSDWIELALQAGAAGAVLAAGGLALFLRRTLSCWLALPSREERSLWAGALAGTVCFSIHGLVEFAFDTPAAAVAWLALLAWLASARRYPPGSPDPEPGGSGPGLLAARALALILVIAAARPAAAWVMAWRGSRLPPRESAAAVERACLLSPSADCARRLGLAWWRLAEEPGPDRDRALRLSLSAAEAGLGLDPLDPDLRRLRGSALWNLGRVADARESLP